MQLNELFSKKITINENSLNDKYILYINDRESTVYDDIISAKRHIEILKKKFPTKKFEIKQESCKVRTVENKNESKSTIKDPEITSVIKFAKNHYPGSQSDEEALDKFIIHSLKHSKKDDEYQNSELEIQRKKISDLSAEIQRLSREIENKRNMTTTEVVANENNNPCWKGFKQVGTKVKSGKKVPRCVPVSEEIQQSINSIIEILEGKQKGKLRKSVRASLPNTQVWPDLDNNNNPYLAYRFGVAMAGAPTDDMDKHGPVGSQFTTVGYTSADDEITKAAGKIIGVKSSTITSKKSKEMDIVNTTSPVPDRNKLKK